ncbi:Linear gramicidin synthase subunit D [Pseudoalteromonas sp. CIP111854]|uniref:Linear gramicidin synthase subunit D n=1 Tax=Pseudoalteromonas holothuriae TaxID=2963714 RepID=A0A9W4VQW4_9GAMM|nr:non-ribosomal peptide synthetase [Pseudoalteromonas sp. CIP111854]CAH9058258.1 Linear gramicidin synthase subunit D [Pseudoalteromonas sp. CIP111854]
MNEQTLLIENLIGEALAAGVTLYEKNGGLAFKQNNDFPDELKSRVIAHKTQIIDYFLQQKQSQHNANANLFNELSAAPRNKPIPLSFAQEGLWFVEQLQGSAQYYMPVEFKLHGELNITAFKQSIKQVIARHEILRTTFVVDSKGVPYQHIASNIDTPFEYFDASCIEKTRREKEIEQRLHEHQHQPFNLAHGPLLRVLLISNEAEHWLAFNMHHIISDGASLHCLVKEIERLYRGIIANKPDLTTPLPIQYADYAIWQKGALSDNKLRHAMAHWQKKLSGFESIQSLPTDRPRPAIQALNGQVYRQHLNAQLCTKLQSQVMHHHVTPFMWMLSCFMLFIGRINQTNQVIVGTPVLGRHDPKLDALIGLFVNTIVIPADIEDERPFSAWLHNQKDAILQALEYQTLPFDKLVDALNCKRDLSHHPLVQILFTLEHNEQGTFSLPNLTIEEERAPQNSHCTIKCDLELNIQMSEQGTTINWKFDRALYDLNTITNWANSFALLLEHVGASPNTPCAHIPLLSEKQKQLLTHDLNEHVDWPKSSHLVALFEQQAVKFAKRIAITDEHGELSYEQLNIKANRLSRALIAMGVNSQQLIPVSVSRNAQLVVTLLATLKAGCAYVPIDPDYPQERIDYIIKDVGSDILICDQVNYARFKTLAKQVVNISDPELTANITADDNLNIPIEPEHLAYMIYTSGTTGHPKGVQIEHRQVVRLLFTEPRLFDFNEQDVWTLFHSFCFDFSVWEMYGALLFGARLIVVTEAQSKDSQAFAKLLIAQKVTVLNQTPSAFYVLQDTVFRLDDTDLAQSHIRYVIFGGEALQPAKLAPWAQRFSHCKLINMYGITETTVHVTYKHITTVEIAQGTSNIGSPIPTTSCYVLDKYLQPLPQGAVGELYVGGEGVCRGYWQREQLNIERFIDNPFNNNGQKLYKTGDLVRYLNNGELAYIRRIDDQVKVRGYRIELGEIENQLRSHPWLKNVSVLLKQSDTLGSVICAFVVLEQAAQFDSLTSQVQQYLRQTLPEFMLPSSVVSVINMPLTSNGKVDKKTLLEIDIFEQDTQQYSAPNTQFEQQIADCFAEILELNEVGREAHFFRLGGHSLLATQVVARLREKTKLNITLKDLFQRPEVKSLAQLAQQNFSENDEQELDILPISPQSSEHIALSFAQQRLWSIDKIQQGSLEYHMSAAFELVGELNIDAFTQAWRAIVTRHEILRTYIVSSQSGEPNQQVMQHYDDIVHYVDASALNEEQQSRLWLKVLRDDKQTAFQLDSDLMLRVVLLKQSAEKHLFLVNMHHIASDGQSLNILVKEFTQFYHNFAHTHALPESLRTPLLIQYADYAHWQRRTLTADKLQKHAQFWLSHLAGAPPLHQLPLDKPRTKQLTKVGAQLSQTFGAHLSAAIRAHCQRLDVTTFTWLHTAYSLLVARFSNSQDVVIGAPFSGRHHSQLEHLIGFFVNTLPIRTKVSEKIGFEALLLQQKQILQDIHSHQDMPFEQIIEQLKLRRDLSHQSVFQLTFSLNPQMDSQLKLCGINANAIDEAIHTVKFDIELSCCEDDNQMRFNWIYNQALFSEQTISSMASAFEVLVGHLIEFPHRCVFEIPLLSKQQSQQLVIRGRYNEAVNGRTVIDEFVEIACESHSHHIALIESDNTQGFSYHFLHNRSNEFAHYLLHKGLQKEQRVVVSMSFGVDLVIAMLGILKAGGCYVPVDPDYPQQRITFINEDCGAVWVITHSEHIDKFSSGMHQHQMLCIDDYHLEQDIINNAHQERCLPLLDANQLAYVIYTSGTTGNPKGVMVPHKGLMNLCAWHNHAFKVSEQSVASQTANIAFDAAAWELWPYLCAGATVVSVSKSVLNAPEQLSQLLTQNKVTHSFLATPIAEVVLNDAKFTPQYLRYLLVGGDKLNSIDVSSMPFTLINNYGPTEASVVATSGVVQSSEKAPDVGMPIDNTYLYILDKYQQPVPKGMIGELYIAGQGLARGYLNRDDLTQSRFVTLNSVHTKRVRAYQTGDLVRQLGNDRLAYIARTDDQIKLRGYRIELGEIEQVILTCHGLEECAVQVFELAGGAKQLAAFIVYDTDIDSEHGRLEAIKSQVVKKLPAYMHPHRYIILSALPLTAHGKVDRRALTLHINNLQNVANDVSLKKATQQESQTVIEKLLHIYQSVLNNNMFKAEDDFFAQGGDSILSIQIASRVRTLGIHIAVADVFNYNTVHLLAEHVKDQINIANTDTAVKEYTGVIQALPIQHWFFEQNFKVPSHWNQALMLSIDKSLSTKHMELVVNSLLNLHEGLRSVVNEKQLEIVEEIAANHVLENIDLANHLNWQSELNKHANLAQESFHFSGTPLLRICHFTTPEFEQHHRLLIVAHHLIIDGVSWRILLEDLQLACESAIKGQHIVLPKRTVSLNEVSQFYIEQAQQQNHLSRWQSLAKLATTSSMLQLKAVDTAKSSLPASYQYTCSKSLTNTLIKDANLPYNTSVQTLLLSALQWCAMHYYQTHSQIIMLEGHGRETLNQALKAERCVSWLTAMFPFHLFSNAATPSEVICSVKEQLAQSTPLASSYGALRYNHTSESIRQSLMIETKDKLFFNYLGQLDSAINNDGLIMDAQEPAGQLHSKSNHLYYGLQVTSAISNGQLVLSFDYDSNRISDKDVSNFAKNFEQSLQIIVSHCVQNNTRHYTPSDFSLLKHVSRLQLQNLTASYAQRAIADIYPMSMLQQGMWLQSQRQQTTNSYTPYLEQAMMVFEGEFDVEAFDYAWQHVIRTHSILRTAFVKASNEPLQIVFEQCDVPLTIDPLQSFAVSGMCEEDYINNCAQQEYHTGIDLSHAPCMRLRLLPISNNRYGFIWTYHHLILDGWSLPVLFANLLSYYNARLNAKVPNICEDKYKDYIAYIQEQDAKGEKAFWQSYLAGISEPTLISDHIICDGVPENGQMQQLELNIDVQLKTEIEYFAKTNGFTLNHVIQAVWGYWLSICCDKEYALFGQTISGRPTDLINVEQKVGLYINTQAVKLDITAHSTVLAYINTVKQNYLALSKYSHSALTQVHNWSDIENGSQLFDALYVFENYPTAPLDNADDVPFEVISQNYVDHTHYPLTLVVGAAEQVSLNLCYDTGCINHNVAEQSLETLMHLLNMFVNHPNEQLYKLPLVARTDFKLPLDTFSLSLPDTGFVEFDANTTLIQRFELIVKLHPQKRALEYYHASERINMSYLQLDKHVNQYANYIQQHLPKQTNQPLIGICLKAGFELIIAILACLKMGAAYLPISPQLPIARRNFMAQNADISGLISSQSDWRDDLPKCTIFDVMHLPADLPSTFINTSDVDYAKSKLCYVIYTSGTTGTPKGVMVEQQSVLNYVSFLSKCYGISYADNYLQFASCSFDVFAEELFCTLLNGATLVLADSNQLLTAKGLGKVAVQSTLTLMSLPTAYWHTLAMEKVDFGTGLRVITIGGEQMQTSALRRWQKNQSATIRLVNAYGPTEATISTTLRDVTHHQSERLAIGKPVMGATLSILDKYRRAVPYYISGELYISGACLARGYLGDTEKTNKAFITDEYSGARLYKTGDKVRINANNELEYICRLDEQVKVRGYRIELGEIERSLLLDDNVVTCAVVVCDDVNGTKQLHAFVVAKSANTDAAQLSRVLAQKLPDYMVPRHIELMAELPLTGNGKVDRKQLVEIASNINRCDKVINHEEIKTPLQVELSNRVKQLLNINSINLHDDFFTLGLHSLLAMRLVGELSNALNYEVPIELVFQHRSIATLSDVLQRRIHAMDHHVQDTKTLVCLQSGQQGYTPIVLIGGAGGLLMAFQSLVQKLDERIPVFGLQPDEIANRCEVVSSLTLTAQHYLSELTTLELAQVHLVGHSFGSFIAYEIAKQATVNKTLKSTLTLLDTPVPHDENEIFDAQQCAQFMLENITEFFALQLSIEQICNYKALSLEQQYSWLSQFLCNSGYRFSSKQLSCFATAFSAQLNAHINLNMRLDNVPTAVIKAQQTTHFKDKLLSSDMGWASLSTKLSVYEIAGNHLSILQKEHVGEIINLLEKNYVLN